MATEIKNKSIPGTEQVDKERAPNVFEGKLVSVAGSKFVMANLEGKESSHSFSNDANLTCDGKSCASNELRPGSRIRVTTKLDDRNVATSVEAIDKEAKFALSK
jgi:hypothetical protein